MRPSWHRFSSALVLTALLAAACTSGGSDEPAAPDPGPGAVIATDAPGRAKPTYAPPEIITEPAGDWLEASCELPLEYVKRIRLGVYRGRSPEVLFVPREPNYFGGFTSTTHSGPWDYVQRVPMVFYGPGFIAENGEITLDREPTLADLAPTLAEILGTPFPEDIPGQVITEALLPAEERGIPKVVLTVVWDGGGWNVLDTWPDAWPYLAKIMEKGTSIADAVAGSSPTVTPAIHTTIGTGTFPKQHGIVDIPVRDGDEVVGAYDDITPSYLEVPTVADLYDQSVGNEALVGMFAYKPWHLGMIGHGAYMDGGDHDIAVISEKTQGDLITNPEWYSLPDYLNELPGFEEDVRAVDLDDGKLDNTWMGHEILDDPNALRHTPVWALFQTRILKAIFANEGYGADDITDLFFTNYKQIDDVGHDWNMLNPEMRDILEYSDIELKKLTRFLNSEVGREQWVMVFTADHGQAPDPIASYAWPIRIQLLQNDVAEHFGVDSDDLYQDERPVGFWLNQATLDATGITAEDISNYLIDYRLRDNLKPGEKPPAQYRDRLDEPVFAAAMPSDQMGKVWNCAKKQA
ncbi:MAG TPA: alkaline phosphatase family protein [Actinomycetota bacterium]|nr:alkaline phosphatase family protein [Actinomycetota bacterium]